MITLFSFDLKYHRLRSLVTLNKNTVLRNDCLKNKNHFNYNIINLQCI